VLSWSQLGNTSGAAYCVSSMSPRKGEGDSWAKTGMAAPPPDGRGFDIALEALPLNARLVLREPADSEKQDDKPLSLPQQVDAFERAVIESCLVETCGKVSATLELLGIPRRTLNEKMTRLGIDRQRFVNAKQYHADETAKISRKWPISRGG